MSSAGHGGARRGAGRKAGAAWKSPRPVSLRAAARRKLQGLLEGQRDPLSILVEIAGDPNVETPLRIHAAAHAVPFVYPRLSAAVISTSSEVRIEPGRVLDRLNERIRLLSGTSAVANTVTVDAVGGPTSEAA